MVELSAAGDRIGDVVKLITSIAEQTNLLALKQLVCGHDVIAALGVALQSLIGSRKAVHCAVLELESKLRLGFSLRDFSATRTYADIKAWEERNPPFCCVA
jgi:hypothetical protein